MNKEKFLEKLYGIFTPPKESEEKTMVQLEYGFSCLIWLVTDPTWADHILILHAHSRTFSKAESPDSK